MLIMEDKMISPLSSYKDKISTKMHGKQKLSLPSQGLHFDISEMGGRYVGS
jgi:hypothetical protein